MFCPTCGRDNASERKFCAACGTNLEIVSQALSGREDNFFTKMDAGLDDFLAKYAERVFKNAPAHAAEQRVAKSWQVLGQSVVTSIVNVLLFALMWVVMPLRFLLLLISTPVRLIIERGQSPKHIKRDTNSLPELSEPAPHPWLFGSVGSVVDHTTAILSDTDRPKTRV